MIGLTRIGGETVKVKLRHQMINLEIVIDVGAPHAWIVSKAHVINHFGILVTL